MGGDYLFILLVMAIPIAVLLLQRWQYGRTTRLWNAEAIRLGLKPAGAAPRLTLSGEFLGVTVEVRHVVEQRYKQSPLISFVARALLSEVAVSSHVPERSAQDDLTGRIVGAWFERSGPGQFGPEHLDQHLTGLLVAARRLQRAPKRG